MEKNNKARDYSALAQAKRDQPSEDTTPLLLVLVGIPGSGKSTFAQHLTEVGWARVSQDDSGDRRACESQTVELLLQGRNVVIDRCNFDKTQRRHWLDYGNARGCISGVVVFAIPMQECIERVRNRHGHPTLKPGGQSDGIVRTMANNFVFPNKTEGFQFCRVIRNEADSERVLTELMYRPQ